MNNTKKTEIKDSISEMYWDTHVRPHWTRILVSSVHSVQCLQTNVMYTFRVLQRPLFHNGKYLFF